MTNPTPTAQFARDPYDRIDLTGGLMLAPFQTVWQGEAVTVTVRVEHLSCDDALRIRQETQERLDLEVSRFQPHMWEPIWSLYRHRRLARAIDTVLVYRFGKYLQEPTEQQQARWQYLPLALRLTEVRRVVYAEAIRAVDAVRSAA